VRPERSHLALEFAGKEHVITVEILDELTPRQLPPCLASASGTGIRLPRDLNDVWVLARQLPAYVGSRVRGAIIDDHDIDGPIRLREDRGYRLTQKGSAVVDGDDRGNQTFDHKILQADDFR
jgi:hypothetical protein